MQPLSAPCNGGDTAACDDLRLAQTAVAKACAGTLRCRNMGLRLTQSATARYDLCLAQNAAVGVGYALDLECIHMRQPAFSSGCDRLGLVRGRFEAMLCGLASVWGCNRLGRSVSNSARDHLGSGEADMRPSSGPVLDLERRCPGAKGCDYVPCQADGLCSDLG